MSDDDKKYDALSTPLDQIQHHGHVSPGFFNLPHADKGYDMSDSQPRMAEATAMLRKMTDNEVARQAGRTSPTAEVAVGALGTSPKKPKAIKRFPKKKVAAKSKKKGGKRKSRRKRRTRRRRKRKSRKKRKKRRKRKTRR